jgi:predicted TPR repeat methyltransferase
MEDNPDLNTAYALRTPQDNRRFYAGWAATYDADFADRMAYRLPALVARAFVAAAGAGPVLDVGAGTGLLGIALAAAGIRPVDGIDISADMLAQARDKGCYRHLVEADLTAALPPLPSPYAGMTSSGTFTHGHLGPEVLPPLLDLCAPGATVAFSVNSGVWTARGFDAALQALAPRLTALTVAVEPIYDAADDAHAADTAHIVSFRMR